MPCWGLAWGHQGHMQCLSLGRSKRTEATFLLILYTLLPPATDSDIEKAHDDGFISWFCKLNAQTVGHGR